jgi:hypothetical protein
VTHLTAEQRRALAFLASNGLNGATKTLLAAHGFSTSMVAGLVNHGLATMTHETVRAGGKTIAVARVRITDAGRAALSD